MSQPYTKQELHEANFILCGISDQAVAPDLTVTLTFAMPGRSLLCSRGHQPKSCFCQTGPRCQQCSRGAQEDTERKCQGAQSEDGCDQIKECKEGVASLKWRGTKANMALRQWEVFKVTGKSRDLDFLPNNSSGRCTSYSDLPVFAVSDLQDSQRSSSSSTPLPIFISHIFTLVKVAGGPSFQPRRSKQAQQQWVYARFKPEHPPINLAALDIAQEGGACQKWPKSK